MIEGGFRYAKHQIAFDQFSDNNIKNYDLVVPLTISDLTHLNEMHHLISNNPIPIPSMKCIQLCHDKYQLNQTLAEKGFGNVIPRMGGALPFPYILKKRTDEWGINSHIISDSQKEQSLSTITTHPEYFSQEFIVGRYEYATHILFRSQQIACSLTVKYAFETATPIKGQDKYTYTTISHCPYLDLFVSILQSIGFNGICCINYKVRDKIPQIFEINPRVGGSLCPYFTYFVEHFE